MQTRIHIIVGACLHLLVLLAFDQFWLNGGGLASAVDAEVATKTQRFVFTAPAQKPFVSRLTLFFKRWNPGLVKNVPALQKRYSGKEHMLLKSLKKVYGVADLNRKPSQLQYNLIQFYMSLSHQRVWEPESHHTQYPWLGLRKRAPGNHLEYLKVLQVV